MKRQHALHSQKEQLLSRRLRNAFRLIWALARIGSFPILLLVRAVHFMDVLGQKLICAFLHFCSALLALAILAGVTFALLRTMLHPWFA